MSYRSMSEFSPQNGTELSHYYRQVLCLNPRVRRLSEEGILNGLPPTYSGENEKSLGVERRKFQIFGSLYHRQQEIVQLTVSRRLVQN